MLLCYCNSDEQVDYRNTLFTYDYIERPLEQGMCAYPMVAKNTTIIPVLSFTSIQTKFFFDSIRKGRRGRRGPIFKRFLISLAKLAVKPSDVAVNRKKLKDWLQFFIKLPVRYFLERYP